MPTNEALRSGILTCQYSIFICFRLPESLARDSGNRKQMKIEYWHVKIPDLSASFVGMVQQSPLKPGMVLLCTPDGKPVFELPAAFVRPSSREEMAKRVMADARHERQRRLARN